MKKLFLISAFALILLNLTSCKDLWEDIFPDREVPLPEKTDLSDVPDNADNIYYLVKATVRDGSLDDGPQIILDKLLKNNYDLVYAWYPASPVMCKAMNATEALIVQLGEKNDKILEYGFLKEPGRWLINCGVRELNFYKF